MTPTISGAVRSKTNYLGLFAIILGTLQANHTAFGAVIDPKWFGLLNVAFGIGVIVLRFYTTESLADKGASE